MGNGSFYHPLQKEHLSTLLLSTSSFMCKCIDKERINITGLSHRPADNNRRVQKNAKQRQAGREADKGRIQVKIAYDLNPQQMQRECVKNTQSLLVPFHRLYSMPCNSDLLVLCCLVLCCDKKRRDDTTNSCLLYLSTQPQRMCVSLHTA
jgi:hypothetical protein